jgi:hypothetical protein
MYLLIAFSVNFPLALVPRGGSAFLHMFPVGGNIFRGHIIEVTPPKALSMKILKLFCPSEPHDCPTIESVQSSQVL